MIERSKTVAIVMLAVVSAAFIIFSNRQTSKLDETIIETTYQIKQLKSVNKRILESNDRLIEKNKIANDLQVFHERKSDSLERLIKQSPKSIKKTNSIDCGDLQNQQIDHLKQALTQCKESKIIYVKRIGLYERLNDNNSVIVGNIDQLRLSERKITKREKRRAFFKGVGVGGIIVGVLLLL